MRLRAARETLELVRPYLSQMGITRIANVTGLDRIGIPTVVVSRPNARSLSVSQGKGYDLDSAKISGVMESLELYHAEHCMLPLLHMPFAELSHRASVVEVRRLPGFVKPFDSEQPLLWTQAQALNGEAAYVPFDLVHANLTLPLPPGAGCFPLGSNGLSSGNSVVEALVHGACELIERDAVALFYRKSAHAQALLRLELTSIDDEVCRELLARFDRAEIGVAIWDVTSDVGIATYYCSIAERAVNPFHRVGRANGYGCHLQRAEALKRALTEAAQTRLTRIAGSRDDLQMEEVEALRSEASLRRQQALFEMPPPFARRFDDAPDHGVRSVEDGLQLLATNLSKAGMERLLYVDLSTPGMPVNVVRVIVPGLEGVADAPGYVAGSRALAITAEAS